MTLPRTIHRRNARKRAKLRPKSRPIKFITGDFAIREHMRELTEGLKMAHLFNRKY